MEKVEPRAKLEDLIDAWWALSEAMRVDPGKPNRSLSEWHGAVFTKVLTQCGWTVGEWNQAVATYKPQK